MKRPVANGLVSSSFRDPSGFLFYRDGVLFRQVNLSYKENYDHLLASGLYETLVREELLVAHNEVDTEDTYPGKAYKVIRPDPIPFISYPYECTTMLKTSF